jgi:carbon monoxide dehydrogenase subunit G
VKIAGTYTINAPQDQVWAALNDIEVLARIVPGCERLEQTGENEFRGTVKIGIQSIKGTYSGRIRLEDIQPPRHYRLIANGKSSNGVVDGSGTVDLVEQDGKTLLSYTGDAQIGGTLASVGQRLIEGASRQLINQSLKALAEQIATRASKSDTEGAAETPSSGTASEDATLAVPWPFPGSTHPAVTSEAPTGGASEAAPGAANEDATLAVPWPFPGSTHPAVTSEVPSGAPEATRSAASEDASIKAPQEPTETAMPWPFPGSTHPSVTSEAPTGSAPEATRSAASEDASIKAPQEPTETAMPWPFPGSTHPAVSSEAPTGDLSAPAPTAPGAAAAAAPAPPTFERRTVVVPHDEQLKPETILRGAVEDFLKERPWLPAVVIAFLLGYLLARRHR